MSIFRPVEGLSHEMLVHGYEEIRLNMVWLPSIGGRLALRAGLSPGVGCVAIATVCPSAPSRVSPLWPPPGSAGRCHDAGDLAIAAQHACLQPVGRCRLHVGPGDWIGLSHATDQTRRWVRAVPAGKRFDSSLEPHSLCSMTA